MKTQSFTFSKCILTVLCIIVFPTLIFCQSKSIMIGEIDSICFTNKVYRCNIIENPIYDSESRQNVTKNKFEEDLVNLTALDKSSIFKKLELLAVYNFNSKLIRLDGFEQGLNCGILYRWYFENNMLIAVVQTRHGFKNASDSYKNTIIKETFTYENNNWIGKRETKRLEQKTYEDLNSWSESLINLYSYRLKDFVNASIYQFENENSEIWTNAFATNPNFSLVPSKYYYYCPHHTYKVKGKMYTEQGDLPENYSEIRFEIRGGKLKFPQQINFQCIESVDESAFSRAKNGLLNIDNETFCLEWIDVNFDGLDDIKLYSSQIDCYYVYNTYDRQFEFNPLLKGNQVEGMVFNRLDKKINWTSVDENNKIPPYFIWDNGYLRRINP